MEIRPVGAELFYADGRTDMTKLTVAFRNFADVSKMTGYGEFVTICNTGNVTFFKMLSRQLFYLC
jgi:hypothetical protein